MTSGRQPAPAGPKKSTPGGSDRPDDGGSAERTSRGGAARADLALRDQRISSDGIVVIKAQQHRSLERNREDGLVRLRELIAAAAVVPLVRRPTKPSRNSQRRRVDSKVKRGQVKLQRSRVDE